GCQCKTIVGAKHVGEDAQALGVALDIVEQQRRAFLVAYRLGDGADLDVPVGAVDPPQLAKVLDLADEAAKVAGIGSGINLGIELGIGLGRHGFSCPYRACASSLV